MIAEALITPEDLWTFLAALLFFAGVMTVLVVIAEANRRRRP